MIKYENFQNNPERVIEELYKYVGVDPNFIPNDFGPRKVGFLPKIKIVENVMAQIAIFLT